MTTTIYKRQRGLKAPLHKRIQSIQLSKILQSVKQLPSLTETTMRAMAIASDENFKMEEFVDVLRRDGAVTALLFKVANSVMYGSTSTVQTVDQAVVRLGLKQCSRLITSYGMKGALRPQNPDIAMRCDIIWRHSLLTAYTATNLSRAFSLGFKGEEFTAALLHDVGRLVLLIADAEAAAFVDPLDFREPPDLLVREQAIIGLDHAQLGFEYGKKQGFPESIQQAIRFHHHPTGASEEHRRLVDLICAADQLTNHALSEHRITDYDPSDCPSFSRLVEFELFDPESVSAAIGSVLRKATKETRQALKSQS